jgi:hypothetical protein
MRLARLAAVGLAIGVIAGFAIALLRPRPNTPAITPPGSPGDRASTSPEANDQLWDQFRKAEASPVVELRSHRRVTG